MTDWSKSTLVTPFYDSNDSNNDWSKSVLVEPEAKPKRTLVGTVKDAGITALKGAIGIPESAVGLADLVSGGHVGKFLENEGGAVGFRPKQAKQMLDENYSDAQKAANAKVANAQGFMDTAKAAIQNPSTIVTAIGESLPSMVAGGAVARGIGAAAKLGEKAAPYLAGLGEGVVSAGQGAEQIRQQTDDGLLTKKQAAIAAGSGALTGLIGAGSNKLASKLGVTDAETLLAGGAQGTTNKGLVRRIGEGALTEGALEEFPQSTQEQIAQNLALGKDPMQGVGNAAAMGLLTGGVMGGGMGVLHNPQQAPMQSPPVEPAAQMPPVEPIAPTPQTPYPNNIQQDGVTRPARPDFTMDLAGKEVAPYQQPQAPAIKPNSPLNNALASAGISTAPPLAQLPAPTENQFSDNGNSVQPPLLNSPLQRATGEIKTPDVINVPAQDGQKARVDKNGFPIREYTTPEEIAQQRDALTAQFNQATQKQNSKVVEPEKHSLDQAIRALGGIDKQSANDIYGGDVWTDNGNKGSLFRNKGGKTLGEIHEALIDKGYLPQDSHKVTDVIDLLRAQDPKQVYSAYKNNYDDVHKQDAQENDPFSPPDMTPDARTPDDDLRDALERVKPHFNEDDFYELATDESLPIEKRTQFLNNLADNYENENDTFMASNGDAGTNAASTTQITRENDKREVQKQPPNQASPLELNENQTEPNVAHQTVDNGNDAKSPVSSANEEQRPPLQQSQIDKLDHVAQYQPDEVKNAIELFKSNPNNKTVENNLRDVADSIYDNYPAAADLIHEALDERNTSEPILNSIRTQETESNTGKETNNGIETRFTEAKDANGATFFPTHQLPSGEKVKLETDDEGNKYFVEHDGSEWDYTDSAEAITNDNSNQVLPAVSIHSSENAKTESEAEAKGVDSSLPQNKQIEGNNAVFDAKNDVGHRANESESSVSNVSNGTQQTTKNETPTPQPILNTNGKPVTSFVGARGALKKQGLFDSHEIVKQDDGSFVSVPKTESNVQAQKNENLMPAQNMSEKMQAQKNEISVPLQNSENSVAPEKFTTQIRGNTYTVADDAADEGVHTVRTKDGAIMATFKVKNGKVTGVKPTYKDGANKTEALKAIKDFEQHLTGNDTNANEQSAKNAQSNNSEIPNSSQADFEQKAHEAATSPHNDLSEPTQAQKESGNYKKGHAKFQGLDITIENPKGSKRSGTDKDGKAWSVDMAHHYGYVKGSVGADNEQVDVFVGDNHESTKAFVVNQIHPHNGKFDEHKVMLGFDTEAEAREGYLKNYAKGWKGLDSITEIPVSELKEKIESGAIKKPIKSDNEKNSETELEKDDSNLNHVEIQGVIDETLKTKEPPKGDIPSQKLVAALAMELGNKNGAIDKKTLYDLAKDAFGGTQAQGAYSTNDATDALEAAFNLYLQQLDRKAGKSWTEFNAGEARAQIIQLTARIQKLPTQTVRDAEKDNLQQFSTPPALSFLANWVANVTDKDTMLEPSAGTGDLAIWSKMAGAKILLNEISPRRLEILRALFPKAQIFKENGEQLNNVLPADAVPTVIVMNPPFSSSATVSKNNTMNGAKHIEQALARLQDGGRLVAIVGNGMGADKAAFKNWWNSTKLKYNVRANIGISGKEYAKYGTTFDNQILVIDKTGATTQPILTGKVESVAELPALLESIRNERQFTPAQQTSGTNSQSQQNTVQSENGNSGVNASDSRAGQQPNNDEGRGFNSDNGNVVANDEKSKANNESSSGQQRRNDSVSEPKAIEGTGRSSDGNSNGNNEPTGRSKSNKLDIKSTENKSNDDFTDSIFSNYTPQKLHIAGAKPHPAQLVQSAAMAAVEPPTPTYSPTLPKEVIADGKLSIAQLEAVVYAGQAHAEILPNGERKGFFIGDNTGVGKGREISGIILDNMNQGKNKAVWVSFNEGLINDAKRDYEGVGGNSDKIFFQGKTKPKDAIQAKDGILFTSYTTVASGSKQQANDLGQEKGQSRLDQIINWLGADFDGVIAFDEAHKMGNAEPIKGKRGTSKPSQQAIAGINLQKALPKARIVYVSATGATELSNLAYATRLGLWGEGTPFANSKDFIQKVSQGGIAAMELVSRDMKALGMYISRSISYDGVSYERLDAQMTPLQIDIYNELAKAWQTVLQNVNAALEKTGGDKDSAAKSSAMSAFWGSQQRFFSQVITALQTPAVIDDIQKRLDNGEAVLVQIVNTNEATQERMVAQAKADGTDLEDLDFTPREMLMSYIRNSFPVAAYEDYEDEEGNTKKRQVTDSNGNPVFDKEAITMRDNLLNTLQQIRVPENPIDSIINAFGTDAVAEVTGRGRRFVQTRNDDGEIKVVEQKRSKTSSQADAKAYQDDKKKILIFSGAGGTGYSFHADNTAVNKRKRIHYIMQAGWKADAAVQGFGRSHRSNQAQPPHYVLPMTHLKAQKRFVSSIARRLDQLGAMTKGQRQTTSQGMFTAADNLESDYALEALHVLFKDMYLGRTQLNFHETATELGLNLFDSDGNFSESKIPTIPQFLNRLLSLTDTRQDQVFEEFEERINDAVEYAKQRGTYDEGVQTLKANSIKKTRDDVAHTDEKTGATTRYVELSVENDVHYADWKQVKQTIDMLKKSNKYGGFYQLTRGVRAGQIVLLSDNGTRLNAEGHEVHRGALYGIKQGSPSYIDNVNELKQGYTWATIDKKYQKVEISKPIDEADAKAMWNEQIAAAPKTETKTERMIVGVILPIWDRLKGSEKIMRMQTDDGEQLLGRMVSAKDSAAILKNLGLDSSASKLTPDETIKQIKDGAKAVLANGWEIFTSTVNGEKRIEIKPTKTSGFSVPEQGILKSQGVFMERIAWVDRFFIPADNNEVFKRITDSKPVVDLLGGKSESQFSKTQSTANAYTKESLNGALQNAADKEFGKGWFARISNTSKFKIIDSNEAKAFTNDKGVQAFYHNGTTYFVADGIASTTDLVGLLKHEIGVHALKMGKDDAGFKSILKQLESMRGKNAAVDEAFNAAERAGTSAANMAEEALGYFVEKHTTQKLAQRFIAWLKKQVGKLIGNHNLTAEDLQIMAREALRKAPDELILDAVEPQGLKLSASAMKSVDANIKRGNESMNKALLEKTTVHRAMYRNDMGWVDFVWGREGLPADKKGRRKGAMGISHIIEARPRKDGMTQSEAINFLFKIVDTIAKGRLIDKYTFETENSKKVTIQLDKNLAYLAKTKGSNAWVVTGFEDNTPDDNSHGNDALLPTTSKSTPTRNKGGAGNENIPQSTDDSIKFSKTQPSSDFELPEETQVQKQQRLWQDMNNRWKTAVDAIKAKGGKINESNNAYDAMERMPHIAAERITNFKRDTLNPLIERVARAKTNFDDIATLLYATHAPERNAEMQKINPRFKNGNGSGMTDQEAQLEIQKLKAKYGAEFATVEAIAKDFQAVTQQTAQMLEQSGAISQEEAAKYKDTYKNYVPLKGFEVLDEKGNRGNGNGLGHSTAKKFGKRALGRESRAGQIIENIIRDHERAIVWQGKAEVGRVVEKLIKDNKGTIGTIDVLPRQSIIKNNKVTSMIAPFDPENEIRFLRNGREVRIQLNDDLLLQSYNRLGESNLNGIFAASATLNRFLRQMWTQKNPAFFLINPIRDIQTAAVVLTGEGGVKLAAKAMKNWRSSWVTMARHATETESKLSAEERDILKRYRESGGSVGTAYISSLERAGDQLHHELARHGGETFQSLIKAGKYKEAAQAAAFRTLNNRLFDFIEHLNTAFEGATRLATFKAAIESGYSDMQAASLSSNVTVNFTKRGELGQQLGAMYLFANANIQGTANIFKTLTESNYKGQAWGIVGGIVALSFIATMMGGDDGEDDLVSDYEKERNISIDIGDGKRITIPVAYGWSFFKDLGRAMAQMANGGDAEKISAKLASSFMGNFSPIGNPIPSGEFSGNNALVAFAPTATKPFVMPTVNKGAFGTPLMPESPFKPNQPDSEKIYRKTRGTGYEDVAKGLNSLTGGDSATSGWIDISPETIKNTINYIAGGAGRFITDSAALTSTPLNDEAYKLENTPIVKSFYKSESIDDYRRRFYAQADDVTKVVEQLQTYKKERNATEFKELYAEKGKLIALNKQVTATKKMLQNLRDREDEARANGTSTAGIEAQQVALLSRFNRIFAG